MRFVNSDALMKSFENVLGAAPCELNGYEIWEVLNAQERIDVIPVEWLEKKRKEALQEGMRPDEVDAVEMVLWMWQKEQEAQDG